MVQRPGGPEEFFEVFRSVQEGKKGHEELPVAPAAGPPPGPADARALTVSYLAAGGAVVIVVLLVLAAYLLGRQHGWRAREAALRRATGSQGAEPAQAPAVAAVADQPEIVDGAVFTLLTLGRADADRESIVKEAEYLNGYAPFRALQVEAYAWRDRTGKYRLCARGFKAMDEATRKRVRDQIRGLMSRHAKREYRDADFLAPF